MVWGSEEGLCLKVQVLLLCTVPVILMGASGFELLPQLSVSVMKTIDELGISGEIIWGS